MSHYAPHVHAALLNIAVAYHQLDAFLGLWIAQRRTILLRPGMSPRLERCVLAHEVGHVAMGHTGGSVANERWANAYAATMLVDPARVELGRFRYGNDPELLARCCEVTVEIMREYLEWESLMPFWQRHTLRDPLVFRSLVLDWGAMPAQDAAWIDDPDATVETIPGPPTMPLRRLEAA